MSSFSVNVDLHIGYNGDKPVATSEDEIVLPGQAGGLTTLNVNMGTAEWWTPSDGSKQLSCVAASPSGNTLAVAERRLKATIHILQGPQRRVLQRLVDVCKLQVTEMAYSRDGTRFVALADAPSHNFSVYAVDPQTERLSILLNRRDAPPADHQYSYISINPRSSSDICTSGGGHLTFWKHESSSSSSNDNNNNNNNNRNAATSSSSSSSSLLVPLEGRVTRPNLRITCHEWCIAPGGTVVAGTTSGLLLLFNLATGVGDVVFDCNTNSNPDLENNNNTSNVNQTALTTTSNANNNNNNNDGNNNNINNTTSSGNGNSIVAIKVTKHHTIVLTEDGTLRFLACLSTLYPQFFVDPNANKQNSNASFASMGMNNASLAAYASGTPSAPGFHSGQYQQQQAAASAGSVSPSQSFGNFPTAATLSGSGSGSASLNNGMNPLTIAGNPHALTLQRIVQVPMVQQATCLSVNSNWDTFFVGCKASGTLTAVHIPGYSLPDVDVSTFLTTEMRFRVLLSGARQPVIGSSFVEDGKYFASLDSSSVLRLCNSATRTEEARVHCGENPSCIAASRVCPVVIVGSETGTIRCYQVTADVEQQQQQQSSHTSNENNQNQVSSCTLRLILSDQVAPKGTPIRMIIPHPTLPVAIAVAGNSTLIFLPLSDPVRISGVCHIPSSYEGISSLSWAKISAKDTAAVMASANDNADVAEGDTSMNAESDEAANSQNIGNQNHIYAINQLMNTFIMTVNNSSVVLAKYPTDPVMTEDLCYPPEEVIQNSWRTDLPLTVAEVALATETNLLCFGGGVDKETKFFNLDRNASPERKDRESKPLKMLPPFRDHEKQLVAIRIIGSKHLLTAGSDGRIVIRDVACLLSSAPNLREIRKDALAVAPRHVSLLGGVRSVSVSSNNRRILTCGYDGSTLLWSMGTNSELQQLESEISQAILESSTIGGDSVADGEASPDAVMNARKGPLTTPETNFWHTGLSDQYPQLPPVELAEEETLDFREKRKKLALDFDRAHAKNEHEKIRKHVSQLQDKLRQVFVENEQAEDDERVELLDFVVKRERNDFDGVCSKKIDEMKRNVRMEDLRCDYVADFIKKTRWGAMKTQLNVIEGLAEVENNNNNNTDQTTSGENNNNNNNNHNDVVAKVHNFAIPHDDKEQQSSLKKVKFLRRMQERNKYLSQKKLAARFASLSGGDDNNNDPSMYGGYDNNNNMMQQQGDYNAYQQQQQQQSNTAQDENIAGGGGDDQQQKDQGNLNENDADGDDQATTTSPNQDSMPNILKATAFESITNHLADIQPFLFEPRDTFAKVRATMQSKLLAARVHAKRVAFNEKFAALVSEKKSIIHQASERANKCKIIQLQLGDHTPLVQCRISDNENPDVVLKVDDDEVNEDRSFDPAYRKKKAQEEAEAERWRRVHGSDDGPERALKTWMDGRLDKEVKEIVAQMDPPDFADEKSNKYVPQDDWTDEQQKIYREFEKKFEKLVESVNEQRRKLSVEFQTMQKATRDSITKFDARVTELFNERVKVAQHCSEAELARVKLALNFMDFSQIITELTAKEHHHVELQNKLISAAETTRRFRQKLDMKKQQLAQLKADELAKERNLKVTAPFSTSEELSRWWFSQQQKRKRGARMGMGGGLNARQKQQAKAAAAAAKQQADANRGPVSPDPWEFLEREQIEAAEARRQEDNIIQANGAAIQYPDRPEMINEHVWQDFLDFIDDRAAKERLIKKMQEEIVDMTQEDGRLTGVEDELRAMAEDAQRQRDLKQRRMIEALFDVDQLFVFRQGHVEYEQDPFITEYGDAVLIETNRVHALNSDIRIRGKAKIELMREEAARARDLRQIDWETRHAEYQTRILELECKQLQTLRVTKQMQEFISGGGEDHNERQRAKLREKIDHVRKTMTQRIEDKKTQMNKVKRQTREREIENNMLTEQVGHADSLLATRRHVHTLHATDTDAELPQRLMRDMRITRRLEDVAKAQIDEMNALKKEVDKLRERTFPSFAVVSKRVIGNSSGAPDGLQQQQQQMRPHSSRP